MELTVEEIDSDTARIVLSGRMDIAGSEAIDVRFAAAANSKRFLVVDMGGVTFLASIGIRSLFAKAKMAQAHGGRLVIAGPQPNVADVLELTGVSKIIAIFPDGESTCARLASLSA